MGENDDATFQELADEVEVPAVVVFTQHDDEWVPGYDIVGDIEIDDAIAMTVKGLVIMILESIGAVEDEADDDEDDDPSLT